MLICDQNEEFRGLIREMLTKNGFFHIVEASTQEEAQAFLREKKDYFLLIHTSLLKGDFAQEIAAHSHYLAFGDEESTSEVIMATTLGVDHVMTFPLHSRKLLKKIESFL